MFYYIILSVIPSCRSACLISALCIIKFCFFAPSLTITSDVVPTRMVLSGLPFKTHSSYRVSNPGSMLYFILSVSDNVLLFCVSPNAARLLFSPESRILRMRPNLVPPNGVERPKALNQFTVSFLFFPRYNMSFSDNSLSKLCVRVPTLRTLFTSDILLRRFVAFMRTARHIPSCCRCTWRICAPASCAGVQCDLRAVPGTCGV